MWWSRIRELCGGDATRLVGRRTRRGRMTGINAIYAMAEVVQAIEQYHKNLCSTAPEHPLCGRPSVCVSTIHGGVGINTVPERATIEIDRRLGPDEQPVPAYDELVEFIANTRAVGACRVEHDPPFMESSGLSDKHNRTFAERVAELVQSAGRRSELVGVPFGTDAAALSAAGVPTIVFGPGSIEQAHTATSLSRSSSWSLRRRCFGGLRQGSWRESP